MTSSMPAGLDDGGDWVTIPTGRLPGDIVARIRVARAAGVEERHLAAILAEVLRPVAPAVMGTARDRTDA
jgi:hypothetical protein